MSIGSVTDGIAPSQSLSLYSQPEPSTTVVKEKTPEFREFLGLASSSDAATPPDAGSVTNVNLNNATEGQVLIASQALGLGNVSGFLETMSSDTNGASATANVLGNPTKYNIPALLEGWASFDASHQAGQGAEQIQSIEKTLVSHADANGNLAVDTATYNAIALADAQ